ncbi:MAG: phosphoadenosine phosphosulfate reductase family protein [Thermofilum sp.]|uniref:phosphoadenosine phosphosulfate reductase domain-containing protein n=1 Tax=Thermofilum sp. TaxID=1961369 RepID=UPI00258F2AFA|nr:phosphoadenosine phosphosulfate reductase family protein [Thermofilum sp.]MCI4409121.1 phosphoadenosine phosphosulfate reductase family protein [Thermofilum sp.]
MSTVEVKVRETFRLLDTLRNENAFAVAFSGGKDSTLLSILLYEWLRDRNIKNKEIIFIHNDTLSEIDILEEYVRSFLNRICDLIRGSGNNCSTVITKPGHSFYWHVIVAGYPAPSYSFRWCSNRLKIIPNKEALNELLKRYKSVVLLTGHREDESPLRSRAIKHNSVSSFFLKSDIDGVIKAMPVKHWRLNDVWEFLESVKNEYGLGQLFYLYGDNKESRYGCWFCTLVKIQKNIYNLSSDYLYFEGVRIIYKTISNMENMRLKKSWGRSELGPLNVIGRGIMLKAFTVLEELSKKKLYGLDEDFIDSYTIREVFYYLDPPKANGLIWKSAVNLRDKEIRLIPIEKIRAVKVTGEIKAEIEKKAEENPAFTYLISKGKGYFYNVLEKISLT